MVIFSNTGNLVPSKQQMFRGAKSPCSALSSDFTPTSYRENRLGVDIKFLTVCWDTLITQILVQSAGDQLNILLKQSINKTPQRLNVKHRF
jgi:hypothetical protein